MRVPLADEEPAADFEVVEALELWEADGFLADGFAPPAVDVELFVPGAGEVPGLVADVLPPVADEDGVVPVPDVVGFGCGFGVVFEVAGGLDAAGGCGAAAGLGRVGFTRGAASPELRVNDQPSKPPRIAV